MKKLILVTFLLIALLLVGIGVFVYLPTIVRGLDFSPSSFTTVDLAPYSDSGEPGSYPRPIQSAEVMIPDDATSYIIIVPERDYDREWNSPGNQTRPGLRLARQLIDRGAAVVRYSPPGSEDEKVDLVEPSESARALDSVLQSFVRAMERQSIPDLPVGVLAVGEGCIVSLIALHSSESLTYIRPERLFLTGCAYTDTLLTSWVSGVFYNMELSGADSSIVDRAFKIWEARRSDIEAGKIPEMDEEAWEERLEDLKKQNVPADLMAFEKTIGHLYRPENRSWTRSAAHLSFVDLLNDVRALRPEMEIFHVMGEYDEEIHPSDRQAQENFVRNSNLKNYDFILLEATDHGLIVRSGPPASPVENMMRRRDPFAEFNQGFLDRLANPKSDSEQ
jgi:hypothetical protein